jgi:hypothetical protein
VEVDECEGAIRCSLRILIAGVENSRGLEVLRFGEERRPNPMKDEGASCSWPQWAGKANV